MTADTVERRRLLARMRRVVAGEVPTLPLYYPSMFNVFRRSAFDRWYHMPGGFGGGLPGLYNKHVFVTRRRAGLEVRGS